jgi:hypothetical protein
VCIVAPPDRLASASAVFFGQRGDVSRLAEQRQVSRQRLYREADAVVAELHGQEHQQQLLHLQEQIAQLQVRLDQLQAQQPFTVVLGPDKPAEFAATAQAEGVSLPVARRLLSVFLGQQTPSVATLGRATHQAAVQAGPLLEVFDKQLRPLVRNAAGDEIFFGKKPGLMVVEPESYCWVSGRLADKRDGEEWEKELQLLPALEHFARDGGTGLQKGVALINQQRQAQQKPLVGDQLDHFHTLREGRRALRKSQVKAERALKAAAAADAKVAKRERQGQARTGYQTAAVLKWQQAEEAYDAWVEAEQILEAIREALRPFTAQGALNSRQKAEARVALLLPRLQGEQWEKFKRQLRQPQTYTYLDRQQQQVEALPVCELVREAVVGLEGVRQNPQLLRGEAEGARTLRGLVLLWGVFVSLAGNAGEEAARAVRQLATRAARASSCVEGINSVLRMQQGRHRKMTQGLLDLKRLYWNLRKFRTGHRQGKSPYELLGLPTPADLSWWQFLQLTPDQLRQLLSAQTPPP